MGAAVRDLLGQAGTLLFQSLPGRSPGGGSDPGSLSAGAAEPIPYQQLYRAAVQGLAVYHRTESLLRPTPPVYGDNVFEKCGINRDGAGEVGKPRYFNGKRHF